MDKEIFESIRVRLKFEEVRDNAINFLKIRDKIRPNCRVWIRMIRQENNKDEFPSYLNFWKQYASPVDRVYYHNIFNCGGQLDDFNPIEETYEPKLPCVALWSLMVFFSNGDVPLCNVDYNNKYQTGSILDNSIQEIWQSKIAKQRREIHLSGEKSQFSICKNCNVWDEVRIYFR